MSHIQCDAPLFPLQVGKQYELNYIIDNIYTYPGEPKKAMTTTLQIQIKVVQVYDSSSFASEAPWLKVSGHDSNRWQLFKLTSTATSTTKATVGMPELVSQPPTTSSRTNAFYYVAGPEVAITDYSTGVDNFAVEVDEIGAPPQQQAAPAAATGRISAPAAARHVQTDAEIEQDLWNSIKDSNDPAVFDAYLQEYPQGRFAASAKIIVLKLKDSQRARSAPPGSASSQTRPE